MDGYEIVACILAAFSIGSLLGYRVGVENEKLNQIERDFKKENDND